MNYANISYYVMQFKDLGKLFGSFDELKFNHANSALSFSELDGVDQKTISSLFKIDSSGVSEFTMAQTQAKASSMGLTKALTNELVALSNDADFTAKARAGKITWGQALKDTTIKTEDLGDALLSSNKVSKEAKDCLNNIGKTAGKSSENFKIAVDNIIQGNAGFENIADATVDVEEKVSKSAGMFESTGNILKGVFATIKGFIPILAVAGAAFAAYKIYDALTVSYSEARDNLTNAASDYEQTTSELESLNSELETTKSRISELKELQSTGKITFAEENELAKLEKENASLERQIKIKERLAQIEAKEQADAAKEALGYKSETTYEWNDDGSLKTDTNGIPTTKKIDRFDYIDEQMEEYKQARKNVEIAQDALDKESSKKKPNKKKLKQFQKNLDNNKKAVTKYESTISDMLDELGSDVSKLYDSTGNIVDGGEEYVKRFNKISNEFNNIDLSKKEKDLNNLNDYFSSTAGSTMKSYLEDIVKNGGTAQDALNAFRESGMRLKDINVSSASFLRYFNDIKKEATETADAIESVDGTFDGMKTAAESANQGANYDTTMGYYKTAKEMYSKGLWGTDDFQTMAQFGVNYDIGKRLKQNASAYKFASDAYIEAWEQSKDLLERWYGNEDELVNMQNVLSDFQSAGLASNSGDEWSFKNDDGTMKFKTTAEAADKLKTSVSNVELAMSKLEEHGFEFDGIKKSGELLSNYKSSLDGIQGIYESMADGDAKDRLGKLLESWNDEYEHYSENLDELSDDQIVKIKFEYDLSTIEQKIQELQDTAEATGDNSDWAAVTVAQKQAIKMLLDKTGLSADNNEGVKFSDDKVKELRSQMNGASEEERANINAQVAAVQTLEENYLKFRNDGGTLNWKDYLNTAEATKAFQDIIAAGKLTADDLKNLFGDAAKINVDVEIKNEKELQAELDKLKNGESITFNATVDDAESVVKAIKNEDGTITYKADIGGVETDVNKITTKDGKIKYTAEFDGKDTTWLENNLGKNETIYFTGNFDGVQKDIQAYKDEDGKIHYYFQIDENSKQELKQETDETGNIVYTADTTEAKEAVDDVNQKAEQSNPKVNVDADTSKAEDKINGLVSDDGKTIIMNVDASTEEVQQQLDVLKEGQTLYFTANVDNVPSGIAAVREQDGTISYIGVDNGVQVYLQQVKNEDGTISYTVGDVPQEVPEAKQVVMREPDNSGVSSNPSSVGQSVVRTADNSGVSSNLPTIFQKVVRFFTGGDKLYGTAHLDGTLGGMYPIPKLSSRALAMGTLQDDSFLRDSWKTAKTEVALTGEKGPEIVIPPNSNRWYTVGDQGAEFAAIPAGSTVFNSKQSKELLTKGKTNSRAKGNPSLPGLPGSMAFLQGTAYASGGRLPGSGGGTSSGSSGSSSPNTSNNNTNTSNTNSDTPSKAEETKETLDWIETELDRIKRNIDLVDKTASSTYKNWSKRNEALVSELSQVSNELNVQQQAYDRYIQQANSVGLSEDWASKVCDGRIDIETITDSDLKDKISDYKTW